MAWIVSWSALSLHGVAAAKTPAEYIRVKFMTTSLQFKVSGLGLSFQGEKEKYLPVALPRSREVQVSFEKLKGQPTWVVQRNMSGDVQRRRIWGNPLALQGEALRVGRTGTPSRVLFFADPAKTRVHVIAVIEMERYLEGVLAAEMPVSWPLEALKAQAVASRSYALFQRLHRDERPFHVEATVRDQVYDRNQVQQLPRRLRKKLLRALEETRGLVLVDRQHRVLPAFFHADCGGHTEEPHNVWGNGRYFGAKKDPLCPLGPYASWTMSFQSKQLVSRLRGLVRGQRVIKVKVLATHSSGRVDRVRIFTEEGFSDVTGVQLRRRLGYEKLKSRLFKVHQTAQGFVFRGRGFGHGVGLCQWGSKGLARQGWTHERLLKHYYPASQMVSLMALRPRVAVHGKALSHKGAPAL